MTVPGYLPDAPRRRSAYVFGRQVRVPSRLLVAVAWATGFGSAVAFSVGLTALLAKHPVSGAPRLLLVGVPLLIVGQLAALACEQETRALRGDAKDRRWWRSRGRRQQQFGALPSSLRRVIHALTLVVFLLGASAAVGSHHKYELRPATGSCPYSVLDYGRPRCLTATEWADRNVGPEQFVASILAGFFVLQCGTVLNTLAWRKSAAGRHPNG